MTAAMGQPSNVTNIFPRRGAYRHPGPKIAQTGPTEVSGHRIRMAQPDARSSDAGSSTSPLSNATSARTGARRRHLRLLPLHIIREMRQVQASRPQPPHVGQKPELERANQRHPASDPPGRLRVLTLLWSIDS